MPVTDPVSSVSGRNSRASNVSGVTGASRSIRNHANAQADTLASAGVLSMLKTSTDTGDIGSLSFNNNRLPTMPRATHQRAERRGHNPRLSAGSNPAPASSSHHYAPSQTSKVSSSREWDSMSTHRHGSLTSMQSMPPSLPAVHLGKGQSQMVPPPENPRDSRSFSMTSAPPGQPLPRHRSATSLKSQEGRPPHHPRGGSQHPPMMENRPPYVYPTRLKRPGYRSPSPALSDTYATAPPPHPHAGPPMGRRGPPPSRPPMPHMHNSDYGSDYSGDPSYLHARPPPRAMSNSPVMGYNEPQPNHFAYRNPAAMRSAPGLASHHPGASYIHPHPPPSHHHAPPHHPAMHRGPYAGPQYPPRPGYPPYPPAQYPVQRGPPPPPPPHVAPMAHNMFHNAARLARQMPQRTDTPMTDGGAPSSDPPSSGTAPTSSSPPTPKDSTMIQVAVDPAFIDPALMDLPDSSSEPALAHQYLRYAEGLEKDVEDTEIEAIHPSVPPSGFVQRVKAMLESKAAADAAADREKVDQNHFAHGESAMLEIGEGDQELYELAANETPRFTILEEFEAPVELPASPVRLPELGGSPIQSRRRITRELVKAELGPSSVDNTEADGNTSIDHVVHHHPSASRGTVDTNQTAPEPKAGNEEEPSTPGPNQFRNQEDTASGTGTTSSPVALGLSAVDYAMRFDSTGSSEETETKDPFILDADTITLQHQKSKGSTHKSDSTTAAQSEGHPNSRADTEVPVSSLLSGEDVSRMSAVSPLQTQTLGIEETIHMGSDSSEEEEPSSDEHTVPGAYPEDSLPPPTPKTPKTYSKSVQLQSNNDTAADTPSTNRYSLPGDLSTVGETSVNDTTDMITDVAVRFSLPQTTITVSKPQIIEIPPTSSPEREQTAFDPLSKDAQPSETKPKRPSVMFADEVAPLKINKRIEQYPTNQKNNDTRVSKSKSIIRRPSPLQETTEPSRAPRESTTDIRFSGINGINNRCESTHLPGLKEESVDEMSMSDKHKSDGTNDFKFPLPNRIAAVKAMQERRLQESAEKAKARRAHRHPNRPLAETRDLPSLNFSRMDLIEKLNEALEVRESKSMDVIRRREFSGIYCPSPQRPQSTEPLRERYMSFFSKPEDFGFFDDPKESEDEDTTEIELIKNRDVPAVEVQPNTEVELLDSNGRPLSPEDFLNVATQVNRLSIPSVSGLSERLSELLPDLRELHLDSVLASFGESMAEDLRRLGDGVRPDTVLSNRTSAGFRTLAERAEEIVKNGTHDSTIPMSKFIGKELPALTSSASADKVGLGNSVNGNQSYLSGSASAPCELGMDLCRPVSALTRAKSPMTEDEVRSLLPPEMNPIARNQKRALILSTGSSRPWNQDENYPWAGTKLDVDLTVPTEAHTRNSMAMEVLRKRRTKSLDITSSGEPTDTTKGIDIGSLYEHNPTSFLTNEQLTGVSGHNHVRKQSKRSVIGSITRKIGLGCRQDGNTTRSITSPLASELGRSGSSLPHRPGERYPTSGLTPPAGFNIEEVRSFFSDNSSEKERNASFRKRLTNFKSKKSVRIEPSRGQSFDGNTTYDAGEMNVERAGATSSAHTIEGVGMGKAEFHMKRFGEKLRHLVAKSGELIRSWSQRSKDDRVRDDWLSDSLYSGV